MKVFDRRYEMMPLPQLEQLQLERLQALIVRLKRNVRRYREQLGDARVESLEDLQRLPFTTSDDMAQSFPYGMFSLPLREVIRLHSTLGPKGTPLIIGHSQNDLTHWGRLVARQFVASGATPNDVIQICLGGGSYRGGAGYVLGAQLIEASVIAEEPFHIDYQLAMLQNYRPTMLITTPADAQELARTMDERRMDPQSLHLRTLLLSRPVREDERRQLEAGLMVKVQSSFGIEEVLNPGLCVECDAGNFHVNEDQFFVESVNRELVVTTLCREAMPLLRYRTGVACELSRAKCPCGRTGILLAPGERLDGRLLVRETPLYQEQIHELMMKSPMAGQPFAIEIHEWKIVVTVEISSKLFSDMIWGMEKMRSEIESSFLFRLGVNAEVRFTAPGSISAPKT